MLNSNEKNHVLYHVITDVTQKIFLKLKIVKKNLINKTLLIK